MSIIPADAARKETRAIQQIIMDNEYPKLLLEVEEAINKAVRAGLLWTQVEVIQYLNETQEKVRALLERTPLNYIARIKAGALGISWSTCD